MIPFRTGVLQVSATTTAKSLKDLIDTAKGSAVDYSKAPFINHIEIYPEGTVRFTLDGATPTTTAGGIATANNQYVFEGTTLDKFMLIASTGTILVNVQIGQTEKQP